MDIAVLKGVVINRSNMQGLQVYQVPWPEIVPCHLDVGLTIISSEQNVDIAFLKRVPLLHQMEIS